MIHRRRKIAGLVLSLIMVLSLLAACSSNNGGNSTKAPNNTNTGADTKTNAGDTNSDSEAKAGIDTSERVELQFYMLGNAPKDLPKIEAEINKMALEDLNATVKFNYTTWTDTDQKYKLLLSTFRKAGRSNGLLIWPRQEFNKFNQQHLFRNNNGYRALAR